MGFGKIIWAVDPFGEKKKDVQRSAAYAIQALTQGSRGTVIEPVYLHGAYSYEVPLEIPSELVAEIQRSGQGAIRSILGRMRLSGLQPLHVLCEPYLPLSQGVDQFLKHARGADADLIVVGTRANRAPKRWVLGSFAEALALRSEIPLLLVNPHWNRVSRFEHILFATDFSDESRAAYRRVLQFAKTAGGAVTLFHRLEDTWNPNSEALLQSYPTLSKVTHHQIFESRQAEARVWINEAAEGGVPVDLWVDDRKGGSVESAILSAARRKAGMIAMAATSGTFLHHHLGSLTRKVIRESPLPVWVIHPARRRHSRRGDARASRAA